MTEGFHRVPPEVTLSFRRRHLCRGSWTVEVRHTRGRGGGRSDDQFDSHTPYPTHPLQHFRSLTSRGETCSFKGHRRGRKGTARGDRGRSLDPVRPRPSPRPIYAGRVSTPRPPFPPPPERRPLDGDEGNRRRTVEVSVRTCASLKEPHGTKTGALPGVGGVGESPTGPSTRRTPLNAGPPIAARPRRRTLGRVALDPRMRGKDGKSLLSLLCPSFSRTVFNHLIPPEALLHFALFFFFLF